MTFISNRELWTAINSKMFLGIERSHVQYFIDRVGKHDRVRELERVGPNMFRVHRVGGLDALLVYCADEYILSEQFVDEVLGEFPDVQIVTNLSSWNRITDEAKAEAKRRGCQVLDLSGVYGSLNRDARAIRDL